MALTKVSGDFIQDGSITQGHLHSSHGITTSDIGEGSNLYFTTARVDSRIGDLSTSDLSEGTNLYYTDARADARIALQVGSNLDLSSKSTSDLSEGTNLYYTQARFNTAFAAKSTSDLSEGTNLYYTDARADARIAAASTSDLSEGTNLYYTDARVGSYLTTNSYATQSYVNTQVSNLVDSAPSTLDTLNELAAALGDDANFSTTVTNSIATKMPLAGGIFTGNVQFNDNIQLNFGSGADFKIKHNGTNSFLENYTGGLYIDQNLDDGDILFRTDDGSGGLDVYIRIDGSTEETLFLKKIRLNDNVEAHFGTARDLKIFHDGSNSYIKDTGAGNLLITSQGASVQINKGLTENMAEFIVDGAVNLYYDSAKKFETTSAGVTVTGTITASGYNNTNWDTAYGWGNHASAGYLTSYTETDTLATVTGRGATTSTAVTFAKATFNTSSTGLPRQITIKEDGDTENSMGSYPGDWTSALNIQSNDASTYLWLSPLTSNIPRIQTNYGQLDFYTGSNTNRALHLSGTSARSEIFYDLNNTGYYANPASTSKFAILEINNGTTGNQKIEFKDANTSGYGALRFYYNNSEQSTIHVFGSTWSSSVWPGNSAGAINLSGYNGVTLGAWNNPGAWVYNSGQAQFQDSVRSPIFYDSNNTAYYTDPNSTGTSLKIAGGIQANTPNGNVIIKHTVSEANSWIFQENATNWGLFWMNEPITGAAFGSYTTVGAEFIGFRQGTATNFVNPSSYTGINTSAYAGWLLSNYSGYFWTAGTQYSAADMRAPIFYDSNDTTYYVNAATGSNLHTPITFQTNDSTLTFQDAGTNAFQMKMSAGDELYLGSNNNYQLQMTTSGNVNTQGQWRFGANFVKVGNSSTYNSDDGGWGSRFVVASTVHARIDCAQDANAVRASWYTHTGQLYSTFGTVTGHDMRLISHNAIRQYLYNGWSQEASSYRAPIFYDSNDTTYYLDPNTTGTSLNAAGKILGSNINTDIKYLGTGVSYDVNSRTTKVTDGIAIYGAYSGGSNSPHTYDMSMQVVGSSRGFELSAAWWTQPALYIRTLRDCCTDWSSWYGIALHGLNPGTSAGALYAPEFYDSNDTGYYINPNSSSKLSGLKLEPASGTNQASGDDNVLWIHRTNNNDWGIQINADQGGATDYGYEFLGGSSHTYAFSGVAAGTRYFNVGSSYAQHDGSFRAPIFYDSNNTAYKADFADTGNSIVAAGSYNAQNYNKPALLLNASGTGSSGAAFGMQQVTAEGWTGVFVDYEPYTGWGLYHDNPNNYFCVTAESSTGNIRSFTVPSRSSGNRTSYEKNKI